MSPISPPTPLPTRYLGGSALEVSVVGLGCNNFGKRLGLDGTAAVLNEALGIGVTLFDTADVYGNGESERLMGEVLEGRRDEFAIATKFGWELGDDAGAPDASPGSREYIRWAVEGSLKRLRVDRIDLYQYHRPDGVTPIAETMAALDELVREGIVDQIGCSNFNAAELEEAERTAAEQGLARFITLQNQYSLLEREIEADVAPACERLGVSILPYFPLASGLLSGKYRRGEPGPIGSRLASGEPAGSDAQFDVIEALDAYALERGLSLLDVAIVGLAEQRAVGTVIAGATKPEQIAANVDTLVWAPSAEDLAELDRIAPTPRT
jgi:aryl-alcohol dehydrogenase-like predicted oxidoreductase